MVPFKWIQILSNGTFFASKFLSFSEMVPFFAADILHFSEMVPFLMVKNNFSIFGRSIVAKLRFKCNI